MLEGYKTYIIGLLGVILSILIVIFNWFEKAVALDILFISLAALGLRRAIDNK